MVFKKIDHGGTQVERIGSEHVKAAWVVLKDASYQPYSRSDFVVSRISVFTRLKHFHVEKQLKSLTDNLKRDQAVVELCFDLVSDGDPALETLWTTTFVATVSFVTIDGGKHPTALWGKDFVAFEAEVNVSETPSHTVRLDALGDIRQFVGAGQTVITEPTGPAALVPVLLEFVEAW